MFYFSKYADSGFTLIETLIAIAVISAGIFGAFMAIQSGIRAIDYSNARFTATTLAQEGVEVVKNIRDNNILEYIYVSTTTPWNQGLPAGDSEAVYDGVSEPYFFLKQPICSPSCDFDSPSLRFLTKQPKGFYNYDPGENTKFKRKIHIQEVPSPDPEQLIITVTVYWSKPGGGYEEISLVQHIYKWW